MWMSFAGFFCTLVCCKRKFYCEKRTAAGLRAYFALAPEVCHALLDAQQTQALRLFHIDASAIVPDRKRQALRFLLHIDAAGGGMRMGGAVVKRFLHDTVDTRFVVVRQIVRDEIRRDR